MLIGDACVSKADGSQSLDLQRDSLRAAGVDAGNVYHDFASAVLQPDIIVTQGSEAKDVIVRECHVVKHERKKIEGLPTRPAYWMDSCPGSSPSGSTPTTRPVEEICPVPSRRSAGRCTRRR